MNPDAALELILNSVSTVGTELVALRDSFGRILAENVIAGEELPPFDNSAMDGYAVLAEDTHGATRDNPETLKVIAEQPAGKVTSKVVTSGTAVRIMTGAPIPQGADGVVVVEETERVNGSVAIFREIKQRANIRPAGEDVKRGQLVLAKGSRIGPAQMGMLASLGKVDVTVYRRPTAAIVTTGEELVDVSASPGPGQIRNSNQYSLLGEALLTGARVSLLERTGDDKAAIEKALTSAAAIADVVIVCGGVSVGDYDYVKEIAEKLGEIKFWKVAIKPGKPLAFGSVCGKPFFGLPGNPVSCMVTFDLFVRPGLTKMMGDECGGIKAVSGMLAEAVRHKPGPREFVRAVTAWQDGHYVARPIQKHGSGILSSMVEANSYVALSENQGDAAAGDKVEIILFG